MAPRISFILSARPLYHKWDVENGFAYVIKFFSLISEGLGGVGSKNNFFLGGKRFCCSLPLIFQSRFPSAAVQFHSDINIGLYLSVFSWTPRKPTSIQ